MSRTGSRIRSLVLPAAVLAATLATGCQKAEDTKTPAEIAGMAKPVTPEQRQQAARDVQALRAPLADTVARDYRPSGEDRDFYLDLAVLTSRPHRLAGFGELPQQRFAGAGSLFAARYVADRLRAMGVPYVLTQDVPVVMPVTTECRLFVDGKEITGETPAIYPARPNLVQASVTPKEGLEGETVYAGRGSVPEYGAADPNGKIVVVEFDCDLNWLNAFAFGARAVVFVGPRGGDGPASHAWQHVNFPANLPRFYLTAETADRLRLRTEARKLRIVAACEWKRLTGQNVIGIVRGTNPRPSGSVDQAVVLAAPLDSYSEVPELSAGARDAANCAALLQLADMFRKSPPHRDVIVCFFDAQAMRHTGARAFYGALYRSLDSEAKSLEKRLVRLQDELSYVQDMERVVRTQAELARQIRAGQKDKSTLGTLFTPEVMSLVSERRLDAAVKFLQEEAQNIDSDILDELRPLRILRADMESTVRQASRKGEKDKAQEAQKELDAVGPEIERLSALDMLWNKVVRDLYQKNLTVETRELYFDLVVAGSNILSARLAELNDAIAQAQQAQVLRNTIGPKQNTIVLHLSVNFGDARKTWTLLHGDDSGPLVNDREGYYGEAFKAVRESFAEVAAADFDERAVSLKFESRMFAPAHQVDSGAIARIFSLFNLSAVTAMDRLVRQGLPCDTRDALDAPTMLAQTRQAGALFRVLVDREGLDRPYPIKAPAKFVESDWSNGKAAGASVKRAGGGRAMADRPVRGAVVAALRGEGVGKWEASSVAIAPPGFEIPLWVMTDGNGTFDLAPYDPTGELRNLMLVAATFDRHAVARRGVNLADRSRGIVNEITSQQTLILKGAGGLSKFAVNLFKTHFKTVVGYGYDRRGIASVAMRALSTAKFREDRSLLCEWETLTTLYAPYDTRGLKLFNKEGLPLLGNAPTSEEYQGSGLSLEDCFEHPVTVSVGAHDLTTLNEYRLTMLQENRIPQDALQIYHTEAKGLIEDARGKSSLDALRGAEAAAAGIERRVYGPLIEVLNDLVTAVVLLLLLAIPFAFALERLLVGTPHIYRQIGWFALFFLVTFGILFLVNPAFKIAATPVIIFLAFAIILLSSLVIFIMVRKLQTEVKKMQGMASTVHSADVSRLSTMMAAVNMGISTMRRRPLRTFLTAVTVVLLTFTILTFASFGSSWGIRKTYEGPFISSNATPRILVRHQLWSPVGVGVFDTLRGQFAGTATVVPRYWVSSTATEAKQTVRDRPEEFVACDAAMSRAVPLAAAIGLDYRDIDPAVRRQYQLHELFHGDIELLKTDGVFLTRAVADELQLTSADVGKKKVIVCGKTLTFAGLLGDQFASIAMLEGSSIRPVDYQASGGGTSDSIAQQEADAQMPDVESAQFVRYAMDRVVILSPEAAYELGGRIRSITLYPEPGKESSIAQIADQAAAITALPTYVGTEGGVYRLIFKSLAKASGWRDLLIPVILGGLIIFATMLGSVSDREREIYTFSSLGLAPAHVAGLFFAEASVYAVVGGMGGYLLGQVVARAMAWLNTIYPQMSMPPMNYSSTNAIVTILIVMGTVLVSTIYPALKASRSANPGIQRSWQIPRPEGNLYDLVFPFTVSSYDITGVVSFLREHFENFSDASLGVFATTECHVCRQKDNDMLGFSASVALAPFDLGVTQRFALLSQASEIPGIDEVRILIHRESGAVGDWKRSNRVFINDLRKQLLIWRSLPHEVMDRYRQKTLEQWDALPHEQVTPESMGGQA